MKDLLEFRDKYKIEYTVDGSSVIAGAIHLADNNLTSLPESIGGMVVRKTI